MGLEPNRPVFAVQTRTTGTFSVPIANTTCWCMDILRLRMLLVLLPRFYLDFLWLEYLLVWAGAGAGAGSVAGAAGGIWLDFLIAAAKRRAVWSFWQRRLLWVMYSAFAAEGWAVWSSRWRTQLWAFSASMSVALCMWDLDLLPPYIGWHPICVGCQSRRGSSAVSVSSTFSSSSGNSNMSISLLPCWHNMCAFLSLSKSTSDWAFTLWNSGSHNHYNNYESCV